MRILLIAGWVSRQPWSEGRFVADLALAFADRGHQVHLAADAVEDRSMFRRPPGAGDIAISTRRPFRDNPTRPAAGVRRFAADLAARTPHDAAVSLTRFVPASVWMPIDFGAWAWLGHISRNSTPIRMAMKVPRNLALPAALFAEARAHGLYTPAGSVQRLLVFGRQAAADAALALPDIAGRIIDAGIVSRFDTPRPAALADLGLRTRRALGITPDRRVLLLSLPWSISRADEELAAFLAGAAELEDRSPLIIALARDAFALHRAAIRQYADPAMLILGRTARIEDALAACDAAAAPLTPVAGPFRAGAMGRFIADSLRFGRPVFAAAGAPGAELIVPAALGLSPPGQIVVAPTPEAWSSTLDCLNDDAWLATSNAAAARVGAGLAFATLVDRVQEALDYVVSPGIARPRQRP